MHVLDVTPLRSDPAHAAAVGGGRVVRFRLRALVAMAAWRGGAWVLDQLIYEIPPFAIRDIEAQTDGVISVQQLGAGPTCGPVKICSHSTSRG